jgi:hypothetical protein
LRICPLKGEIPPNVIEKALDLSSRQVTSTTEDGDEGLLKASISRKGKATLNNLSTHAQNLTYVEPIYRGG